MDATRAKYYRREAKRSARIASDALKRGDFRAARKWAALASEESELAAFWASDESPAMPYLKPAFMFGEEESANAL